MLKQLSRLEKTRNYIIWSFVILMAASLIFFYAPGRNTSTVSLNQSTEALAKVGGDYVTVGELVTRKEAMQRRFGGQINMSMFGGDKRILDGLIRGKVVAQEAERLGFSASDAEVAAQIRKDFKGPDGNFVGMDRYQQMIKSGGGDIEKYEQDVREGIASQKLEAFITAGVSVSDQEVLDQYKRTGTSFELSYVAVSADKLAQKITPSDDELKAYFEQHKKDYYINSPQKRIRYIYIDQTKAGAKLNIPDEELKAEYDKLPADKKQAGVKVQQIVLKIADPKLEATVKAKADDLVKKARGESGTATEQAFADLAKGNSEDPATAKNSGWVNGVVRRNPNNPSDPLQQTLEMTVGNVTDPIKYKNAFFIFRRGDAVPKSFEDAKQELLVSARNRKAYTAAAALAQKAVDRMKDVKDAQKVAQELAAGANMTPAEMVKETPFVKPGDDVPNIGNSPQFEEGIAPLNNVGDVGERTPIKGGFAIPMLIEKKDPRDATFEEVKDKVTDAVKKEKAKNQVEQIAKDIANAANSPADLSAAAEKNGLKALEAKEYKLGSPLGETGPDQAISNPTLENAIYDLKEGSVTKTPIKSGEVWLIVGATKRKDADMADYEKQKDTLKESALSQKKSQIFNDYIQNVMERMKREGSIVVYKDVLAKIAEPEPTDTMPVGLPPGRQSIPIPQQ